MLVAGPRRRRGCCRTSSRATSTPWPSARASTRLALTPKGKPLADAWIVREGDDAFVCACEAAAQDELIADAASATGWPRAPTSRRHGRARAARAPARGAAPTGWHAGPLGALLLAGPDEARAAWDAALAGGAVRDRRGDARDAAHRAGPAALRRRLRRLEPARRGGRGGAGDLVHEGLLHRPGADRAPRPPRAREPRAAPAAARRDAPSCPRRCSTASARSVASRAARACPRAAPPRSATCAARSRTAPPLVALDARGERVAARDAGRVAAGRP